MEVEVKLPKPGDQLPFVVAESEDYKMVYLADRSLQIWGKEAGWLSWEVTHLVTKILGIPQYAEHAVAPTERGEE